MRLAFHGPSNPHTDELIYPGWEVTAGLGLSTLPTAARGPGDSITRWVFGANWDWKTFDYNRDMALEDDTLAPVINSMDPDLGAFKRAGGKLLMTHGWADAIVVPRDTLFYYNRMMQNMKLTLQQAQDFARVFMVPGMGHCSGGTGPNAFDALTPLVQWVEQGIAPEQIVATRVDAGVQTARPLCPYPQEAHYLGSGDTKAASSFGCVVTDQNDDAFEVPGRSYLSPFVVHATAYPDVINSHSHGEMTIKLDAPDFADDFGQWQLSNLKLEGVPAISGKLSKDRRSYVAKFPKNALAGFDGGQSSTKDVVDVTVTGDVTHNGTQSSFGVGAAVRLLK